MKKFFLIFALAQLISACATSDFAQTGSAYPPYKGVVKVYSDPPLGLAYEEIGIVSSSGGMIHEWTHLIKACQKEAAKKGADAIILVAPEKNPVSSSRSDVHGSYSFSGSTKSLMALAIRTTAVHAK